MNKKLSEMTLDELWNLFPIELTEHKSEWAEQYQEMETFLRKNLSSYKVYRISHIGSTAIKSIWAKPIIDILVEISPDENMKTVGNTITDCGFIKMSESEQRESFNKGYTEDGFAERVFHLHLRYSGDNHELYFRDYLNDNPDIARDYERLKINLWHIYEHDRDAYTEAKTAFVQKYTAYAIDRYGICY